MKYFWTFFYLILIANVSWANENSIGLGLKAGTTGFGLDATYGLNDSINLRAGLSTLELDEDVKDTDVKYEAEFEMNSLSLLADWHPFKGGFRVTGGIYYYFDNKLTGDAEPTGSGTYTINDTVYDTSDLVSLEAEIEFDSVAPYVGIGWGNAVGGGRLHFAFDLGLINIGSPDVDIDFRCVDVIACATINSDIAAETKEVENDVEDFEWWPVLNAGISYKF